MKEKKMSQYGTDGNDLIMATHDTVYALDGYDRVFTANIFPIIYGGNGNDFIANSGIGYMKGFGGIGFDTIHGGAGSDELYGESGDDVLVGGEFVYETAESTGNIVQHDPATGDDYLDGGNHPDALYGLDGNDTLLGGDGDDFNNISILAPNNAGGTWSIRVGLYGGTGDDYLDGGRGNDYLDGGADNDTLVGGLGNDTLVGGEGNDALSGSEGNDKLYGGAGNDMIWADQGADIAYGGTGNDTIYSGIADAISALGEAGNDTIATGNGNDYIDGGAANDIVFAGGGNDTVLGGNGSDSLGGYIGNDVFYGDYNVGGLDYFNLSFDVRPGDADYIADFKAGGVKDYIILPSVYSGSVYLTQYGTDVIGYIAQGSGYYSFQVHGYAALTVAEVQAALFFA